MEDREKFGDFSWKADNNQANIELHHVSFQRASIVLENGNPVITKEKTVEDAVRQEAIGRVNGDTIKVVYEVKATEKEIISAYEEQPKKYDNALVSNNIVVARPTENHQEFSEWKSLDSEQYLMNKPFSGRKESLEIAIEDRKPRLEADQVDRAALEQRLSQEKSQSPEPPPLKPPANEWRLSDPNDLDDDWTP